MSYNGLWASLVPDIKQFAARGMDCEMIASALCGRGPEPISAHMVRYILRGGYKPKPKVARIGKWQTWTPEMQEAEFEREYS